MQNLTYDDLCTIEKDEDDRIRLIKMNSVTINKLNSQIGLEVQEKRGRGVEKYPSAGK